MDEKIKIFTFTDPMLGLSYECEPIFRKLETHFAEKIEFNYIMSGLVKNVYNFVDPDDLKFGNDVAIKKYNARLAEIYLSEEKITGMPINMENFQLFSTENISTAPLNIAYKAVQIVDAAKAENFLYNLRYATIVECRPTTKTEEILKVVEKTGVDRKKFLQKFMDGTAKAAFEEDLKICERLNIHSLPSYLIQYGEKNILIQELIGYEIFVAAIDELSNFEIKPKNFEKTQENLEKLLRKHKIISPIEIKFAFDFENPEEVEKFLEPLQEKISIKHAKNTYFVEWKEN